MKKTTFTALTVAICTAASTVSYGAVFSDIGSNLKWAESYINSVYDIGLMVGDYNSRDAYQGGCVLPAGIALGFGSSAVYLGASQVALGNEPTCQCRRC